MVFGEWVAPAVFVVALVVAVFELDVWVRRLAVRRRAARRGGWLL